MEIRFNQH